MILIYNSHPTPFHHRLHAPFYSISTQTHSHPKHSLHTSAPFISHPVPSFNLVLPSLTSPTPHTNITALRLNQGQRSVVSFPPSWISSTQASVLGSCVGERLGNLTSIPRVGFRVHFSWPAAPVNKRNKLLQSSTQTSRLHLTKKPRRLVHGLWRCGHAG